jgi:hypothetical protein
MNMELVWKPCSNLCVKRWSIKIVRVCLQDKIQFTTLCQSDNVSLVKPWLTKTWTMQSNGEFFIHLKIF